MIYGEQKISGVIHQKEYIRYILTNLRSRIINLAIYCFSLPYIVDLLLASGYPISLLTQQACFFSLSGSILITIIFYVQAKFSYKNNSYLREQMTFHVNDEGITQKEKNGYHAWEWEEFSKIHEYKSWFLLRLSGKEALFIPKRFFDSHQEVDDFRELMISKGFTTLL